MPAQDILLQSIIDRLDRIEDKIDSHIAQGAEVKEGKTALDMVKSNASWVVAVLMGLGMVFGGSSNAPKAPSAEQWKAVASSTYVASKRLQEGSK